MPNRILREGLLTSEHIARLTGDEHRLYTSLMLAVDDFGRFDGRAAIIRGRCLPLLDVTLAQIDGWLDGLERAELLRRYEVDGKPFVHMLRWRERARTPSKCPPPPDEGGQTPAPRAPSASNGGQVAGSCEQMRASVGEPRADAVKCEQMSAAGEQMQASFVVVVGDGVVEEPSRSPPASEGGQPSLDGVGPDPPDPPRDDERSAGPDPPAKPRRKPPEGPGVGGDATRWLRGFCAATGASFDEQDTPAFRKRYARARQANSAWTAETLERARDGCLALPFWARKSPLALLADVAIAQGLTPAAGDVNAVWREPGHAPIGAMEWDDDALTRATGGG